MTITYRKLNENDLDVFIKMRINQLREEGAKEDIDLTERMVSAGKILGIDVLDHLIIGTKERAYTSLRELGVMEFPERDWRELERAADRQPEHTL